MQHVLAVASGKGGVGKSTVAVNLALAMSALGQRVGLMDADVYGPSVAMMMGVDQTVTVSPERRIIPLTRYGVRYVSMALFINDQTPVIWRGPMVTKLETEFLFNVEWGELDCLVLDLPPGTGDAQLTITQRVDLAGGVIVTTPQEVALLDVKRGVAMFNEVHTPVLGVIENMSYYVCRKCAHRHEIFGHGGGARMAAELDLPLLGELPIVPELRAGGDNASAAGGRQSGPSRQPGVLRHRQPGHRAPGAACPSPSRPRFSSSERARPAADGRRTSMADAVCSC